jgi:predicted dehydrogenase
VAEVAVVAVAARDRDRAAAYAARYDIPVVHDDYDAVLDDPAVDAVYVPLPNALHARWTLRALAAGKHVLCEKPFAANAEQAAEVADAADAAGLVVAEGLHYRYHPLADRMVDIVRSGELGRVHRISATCCLPVLRTDDVVCGYGAGGGATMINGCYPLSAIRLLGQGEPVVTGAVAKLRDARVDRAMTVDLRFPDGCQGRVVCSIGLARRPSMVVRVSGEKAEMKAFGYVVPHVLNRLSVGRPGRWRRQRVPGDDTYVAQLRAFAAAVRHGEPVRADARDAVATMRLIDDAYRTAGLPVRGLTQSV